MSEFSERKQSLLVMALSGAALLVLALIYFTPIWWVSLTAPNYPVEAFPDGVRIHFHMNGVFNGCRKVDKVEIQEDEALDCVHEMDTINHYVGMYPIAAGAPIERSFSVFLLPFLGVMILGFASPWTRLRLLIMSLGFAGILAWMSLTLYTDDGMALHNEGYVSALISALDQDTSDESAEAPTEMSAGQALIARLKASLEDPAATDTPPAAAAGEDSQLPDKQRFLNSMRITFEADQAKRAEPRIWNGSGLQVMVWHYRQTLGRYFNNPAEIEPMVAVMKTAIHVVFFGLIGAMLLLLWGARKSSGLFFWLLALVPILLPVFFVIDYAAWLWWFGHNMNEMGAFTVKAFMPTVLGDGKVAQFTTHSYPYKGFGLIMLFSLLMAVVALIRRKQLKGAE